MSSWAPWPCMRIVWHSISVGPPPPRARRVATRPPGQLVGPPQVVGEVAVRGHAAHEVGPEVAVEDAEPVPRRERERRTDRDRLLPAAVVERPGHLPLLVQRQGPFLGGPH